MANSTAVADAPTAQPTQASQPTLPPPAYPSSFAEPAAPPPNLMLGILRRWPWLVLGLGAGLVLGLLYHMQRSPVYQATAQLLVIKNRPELVGGGAGDTRVQMVEDYVSTQVVLLTSERILEQAAKRLDDQKPFQVPPPDSEVARVAFLKARFTVAREKEPGTNTPSNILKLTFNAPNPSDAPKYLRAIIAAYEAQLAGVYAGASAGELTRLDADIAGQVKVLDRLQTEVRTAERKMRGEVQPGTNNVLEPGVSQEELSSIRARVTANHDAETKIKLRQIVIANELKDIGEANTPERRQDLMTRFGIQTARPTLFAADPKDPDSLLALLAYKKSELAGKFGPGHPEMISLTNQIAALEKEVAKRGGVADELELYRRKLENERLATQTQLDELTRAIKEDEGKTRQMAELQQAIDSKKAAILTEEARLRDWQRERERVLNTEKVGGYKVESVTQPTDGVRVAPVLAQSLLLGAVLGLLLGGGLGLWAELADRSFRSPADIRRHLGIPVLGHVPPIRTTDPPVVPPTAPLDPVLAVYLRPKSAEAEAVRGIRTQLLFNTNGRTHQVIQVTSPNPGDGKSTLAANLAVSLAKSEKRVVLVDCDFRKPRVHKIFALTNPDLGLASVVSDQADLGGAVQGCEIENLSLLPCGPRPANPAELLTHPKFKDVLDDLRATYDFVVLDTPPVLAVSDPAAVAPRADGVVLVFRMTKDARPAAERAKEELTAVGGRFLGVVVNASTERDMGYGYGYGYRYDYQYSDSYADK